MESVILKAVLARCRMRACVDTPRGSPERLVVICVHVHVRAQYSWGSEKEATDHNMGDMNGGHANYQWINIQHTAMGHGTVTPTPLSSVSLRPRPPQQYREVHYTTSHDLA